MENNNDSIVITAKEALDNRLTKAGYEKLLRQNKQLQSSLRKTELLNDELSQKLDELQAGIMIIAELVGAAATIGAEDKDLITEISERIEELNAIKESKKN